jgi:hypothetical protein
MIVVWESMGGDLPWAAAAGHIPAVTEEVTEPATFVHPAEN